MQKKIFGNREKGGGGGIEKNWDYGRFFGKKKQNEFFRTRSEEHQKRARTRISRKKFFIIYEKMKRSAKLRLTYVFIHFVVVFYVISFFCLFVIVFLKLTMKK